MNTKASRGRKKGGSSTRVVAKPPKHVNLDLFGIEERLKLQAVSLIGPSTTISHMF